MADEFQTDGQTDVTNLAIAFHNFTTAPNNRHNRQDSKLVLGRTCNQGRPVVSHKDNKSQDEHDTYSFKVEGRNRNFLWYFGKHIYQSARYDRPEYHKFKLRCHQHLKSCQLVYCDKGLGNGTGRTKSLQYITSSLTDLPTP